MLTIPPLYPLLLSFAAIITCVITDLRWRKIHPLICLIFALLSILDPQKNYLTACGGAFLGFSPLFIMALFGSGGGGDALLAGALGFILPFRFSAYMFLMAFLLYIVILAFLVWKRKNRKLQLPYAPFLGAGWLTVLIISLFTNGGAAL